MDEELSKLYGELTFARRFSFDSSVFVIAGSSVGSKHWSNLPINLHVKSCTQQLRPGDWLTSAVYQVVDAMHPKEVAASKTMVRASSLAVRSVEEWNLGADVGFGSDYLCVFFIAVRRVPVLQVATLYNYWFF